MGSHPHLSHHDTLLPPPCFPTAPAVAESGAGLAPYRASLHVRALPLRTASGLLEHPQQGSFSPSCSHAGESFRRTILQRASARDHTDLSSRGITSAAHCPALSPQLERQ